MIKIYVTDASEIDCTELVNQIFLNTKETEVLFKRLE